MRALLLTVALTMAAPTPQGQPAELPTIVGIPLGKPLTLPICPADQHGVAVEPVTDLCYENAGVTKAENDWWFDLPEGGSTPPSIRPAGRIHVDDGVVTEIRVWTRGVEGQDQVMDLLTAKFGRPTLVRGRAVQNRMGAQFTSTFATWERPGFLVTFDATGKDLDDGMIFVETAAHAAAEAAKTPKPSL